MTTTWALGGLETLRATMERHVERGELPGLAYLVERNGEREVVTVGAGAFGAAPLQRDALFRITSISKPIVAAAAMRLIEDGRMQLDAPVARWLPELAAPRVLRTIDAELDDTVPAEQPVTVEHLLTSRLGFGTVMAEPGSFPIQRAEEQLGLGTLGPPWPPARLTSDEWIARFATLPLMHRPGGGWMYNTSITVLGILLERVVGGRLGDVLRELLLEPLGMHDTGFVVAPGDLHRLTTAYEPGPDGAPPVVIDRPEDSWWSDPAALANGAGWLVSTVDDVGAFAAMIASGGEHEGRTILCPDTVRAMSTDHLDAAQRDQARLFVDHDGGWGYGMRVPAAGALGSNAAGPIAASSVPGGVGWDGGTGTSWRWRPDVGLTGVLLTQLAMTSPVPPSLMLDFWTAALAAVR